MNATHRRSATKRSKHHLKFLIESLIAEEFKLRQRGIAFIVDELEVTGHPPERIKVWATVHFLALGSPFCCCEPECHVPLFAEGVNRISDAIRRRMQLRQAVSLRFVAVDATAHADVEFDDAFLAQTTPVDKHNIDQRDALGRTALMRAAFRGYDRQVESLLAAGADPTVTNDAGKTILDICRGRNAWITTLLEEAIERRGEKHLGARP